MKLSQPGVILRRRCAEVPRSGCAQGGAVLTWILLAVLAGVIVIIILILIVDSQPPTMPKL